MRAPWRGADRTESRGPALHGAVLLPLDAAAQLYGAGASLHRWAYQRGLLRRRRLSCRVVSVGNLVLGGSGKTPAAAWIARELHRRGHRVALASRGYGRSPAAAREPVRTVSDGRFVRGRAAEVGDEPMLLAAHAPGVPVMVGRDRGLVGLRAISGFGSDILVLDDGFQHHRLERDAEILAVDGRTGFGNGRVLPRGPLREPLSALRLVDAVLVIDGPLPEEDGARLERFVPWAQRFAARRRPVGLRRLAGGRREPPSVLDGREVGLLSGIAGPGGFRRSVEALGARVAVERRFRDHHRYRPAEVSGLAREAPLWVTTEKDAVKILPGWIGDADVRVLEIELEVEHPDRLLDWLESRLRQRGAG